MAYEPKSKYRVRTAMRQMKIKKKLAIKIFCSYLLKIIPFCLRIRRIVMVHTTKNPTTKPPMHTNSKESAIIKRNMVFEGT